MSAVYNEIDPFCAEWLERLIMAGLIAPGDVDTRSIEDVSPDDWRSYVQVHAFAGIGLWSHALRLAGWPDERPVWTGSCPCQPFSAAGKGGGFADERHLWPAWGWLIDKCRPDLVLGEQVAAKPGLAWFDLVSSDLEGKGYTVGAADLCAAGVGAPHIRQRLWWAAHRNGGHASPERQQRSEEHGQQPAHGGAGCRQDGAVEHAQSEQARLPGRSWFPGGAVADGGQQGLEVEREQHARAERPPAERGGAAEPLANNNSDRSGAGRRDNGEVRGLQASQRQPENGAAIPGRGGEAGALQHPESHGRIEWRPEPSGRSAAGFWGEIDWIACRDGKWRPVEPSTFPLAHGYPARVGRLRAYGNAIVPALAAAFIEAVMAECP